MAPLAMAHDGRWRVTARRALVASVVAIAVLGAADARAQTPEELAAARQVFIEGKDLEKRAQWAEALERFKKVAGVKMTPQVRFHIALCEENLGRFVSATRGFELAAAEAKLAGSTAAEVAEKAPARAEALRKRIATLHLEVQGNAKTSTIFLDDAPVAASSIGVDVPIDPGEHVIEVRDARAKVTFRKELTLAEGGTEQLELIVDDVVAAPAKVVATPPPPPPSRVPAYIVGAASAGAFVAAGVLYGLREGAINEVAASCKGQNFTRCDPKLAATSDMIPTYTVASGVALGVGIAGAATAGVLWFVLGPKKAAAAAKSTIVVAPTGPGVELRAAF